MARIAKGAVRVAGRDALPERNLAEKLIKGEVPPPSFLPSPPKEAYYVFAINGPIGRLICPAKCEVVRIIAWMESANNLVLTINPDNNPIFSASIPVIRGKQVITRESFAFKEFESLDIVTFEVTKPTDFCLSVVFREL